MDRVRIPAALNDEDVFFSFGPVKMSLRQLSTVGFCFILWYGLGNQILPGMGLSGLFAFIATIWLPILGIAISFVKIKGRPLDMWIGFKFTFMFGPRTYLLRKPNKDGSPLRKPGDMSDDDLQAMIDTYGVR